ncbi:hypothetical protein M407DRAFT_18752, partial [Tulasnella calospora MUT 4182]
MAIPEIQNAPNNPVSISGRKWKATLIRAFRFGLRLPLPPLLISFLLPLLPFRRLPSTPKGMPFRARTLPDTIQLRTYIEEYPYPAFVLNKRVSGKHAASLLPIFTNAAFRNLVFGPRENEPQNLGGGGLLEALAGTGFEGLANARRLGEWIEESPTTTNARFIVDLEPAWIDRSTCPIQLELIKTAVDAFWIITSVPRSELPKY